MAALVGQRIADLPAIATETRQRDSALRGLALGLETAFLDLAARRAGLPLYALMGGKRAEQVPDYYSLSCGDPGSLAAKLAAEAAGWPVVQVKLGIGDPAADRERLRAALPALGPDQTLLADFNGAWDVATALSVIAGFDDPRIIWEEPCDSVEANSQVVARSGRPVMFDQCLETLATVARVVAEGRAHSVCIKPGLLGGLEPARAARDLCIEAGMPMRIDGPWCGHIATAACLHLAIGAPAELLIAGCDLRQPLRLDEDWGGTRHLPGHRIAPTEGPGHGAAPPSAAPH